MLSKLVKGTLPTLWRQQGKGKQSAKDGEGATLFNMALPGLEKAEGYYGKLSSGDPNALATANAPAIQQIGEKSNEAKKSIIQNNPRGGERNLALEEADITKGAQISNLTTGSYVGAFPSLASLGGQNVAQGNAATGTGLQGMNAAANQYGQLQQINNEQKATQLGFITSLAGAGATAFAACWVAAELFTGGWAAYETRIIRRYLKEQRRHGSLPWRLAVEQYVRHGRKWATHIQTHKLSRAITLRIFEWLFCRAQMQVPERTKRVVFDSYWETTRRAYASRRP
jgi:hypothetical protein